MERSFLPFAGRYHQPRFSPALPGGHDQLHSTGCHFECGTTEICSDLQAGWVGGDDFQLFAIVRRFGRW